MNSRLTSTIPNEKLPECWNNDERMASLYSATGSFFVNSNERAGKFQFWKKMIAVWCQHNRTCYFSIPEIKNAFVRNSQIPTCLPDLIEEMKVSSELMTVEKLLQFPSKTWSNWAYNVFVSKPLNWSYDTFWSYLSKNDIKSTNAADLEYVFMPVLKEQARNLFEKTPQEYRSKLVNLDDLLENVKCLNGVDSKTLLLNILELQKQGLVDVMETTDDDHHRKTHLLVKFALLNQKCSKITNVDKTRFKLEQSEAFLLKEIAKIEEKVEKQYADAKVNLQKNKKIAAKNCLRRKQELEKVIVKRQGILTNIQTMLEQFENAEFDSHVIETYRKGVDSLKTVFKGSGIEDVDKVSDAMLDLEEVTDLNDEILQMISEPVGNSTVDDDIEAEFNELIAQNNLEKVVGNDKTEIKPKTVEDKEPTSSTDKEEQENEFLENIEKRLLNLRSNPVQQLNPSQ